MIVKQHIAKIFFAADLNPKVVILLFLLDGKSWEFKRHTILFQVRTLTVVAFLLFSTACSESLPGAEILVGAPS